MADFLQEYYIILLFVALAAVLVSPIGGLVLMLTTSWVAGFRPAYARSVLVALSVYVAALVLGGVLALAAYYVGYLLHDWLGWSRGGIMIGVNVAIVAIAFALVMLWALIIDRYILTADGARMGMRQALRVNLIHLVLTAVAVAALVFLLALIAELSGLNR